MNKLYYKSIGYKLLSGTELFKLKNCEILQYLGGKWEWLKGKGERDNEKVFIYFVNIVLITY